MPAKEESGQAAGLRLLGQVQGSRKQRGLVWLTASQDKTEGSWAACSLNKNKEHHISPKTALPMNDAATSYAVLSLTAANPR